MITKCEAQILAVEACDYEMPSEWERQEIIVMSCDFDASSNEWKVSILMNFAHGDSIAFDCEVSADGEVSLAWGGV